MPRRPRSARPEKAQGKPPLKPGSLRTRQWERFLRGPDPQLLEDLYVPALSEAVRYDRCCSYFSSSVLAAAARGFGRLIERLISMGKSAPRPAVRLVVNEELVAEDVRALTETGDLSRLEEVLERRFRKPRELLVKRRLAMLGWLAREGLLEVRVGVMRHGEGIVHGKFGVITDEAGDAVVFNGSGNESARGLLANYERLEVSTSWEDPERHREYSQEFEALWKDEHPDVHTVTLPEAVLLKLIKFAPKEPPIAEPAAALERQKKAMVWSFITEAPYLPEGEAACDATAMVDLWPHQRHAVEETAKAWPDGRLLCDEVGLGKTIEAIFVLRRLMAGRGVRRALFLLPKSLVKQWQGELREKGGLVFPRLDGAQSLVWPDGSKTKVSGLAEALQEDVLLMSRETARTEGNKAILLSAEPWDLVLLDEAHAARRRRQEEGEFNSATLLLDLLRQLQLRRQAKGLLLLSATPMQTHPWEPWDLLAVLGEGGVWLAGFSAVRDYYQAVSAVQQGRCDIETAKRAAALIAADPQFPETPGDGVPTEDASAVAGHLAFALPRQREGLVQWLRQGSPLGRRMRRATRDTLRGYHSMGLLDQAPPLREVRDILFDFQHSGERRVYESITDYIDRRFEDLEREKPGKGFVMTIYRRRAASSPLALERSLKRRKKGLGRVANRYTYQPFVSEDDVPEALDVDDFPEAEGTGEVSAAFPQDPQVARDELAEVDGVLDGLRVLGGVDSKRDRFFDLLREVTEDGRPVLVFTEYCDTLEYLRDQLVTSYGSRLGCFRGDGGQLRDGQSWRSVTKDEVTRALQEGQLQVLICTDAASEGLNLQAAGAVVNYDLPWNPSRVEQRIGRIDRIGQRYPVVRVMNLFLKDSVDERVYAVLRQRCGLFEHFVGPMQPVLARARRVLMGQEAHDEGLLEAEATRLEQDPIFSEAYVEALPTETALTPPPVERSDLESALLEVDGEAGIRVRRTKAGFVDVSGLQRRRVRFAPAVELLERNPQAVPLSPLSGSVRRLPEALCRPGERLPLVTESVSDGAFRVSVAYWVGSGNEKRVRSLKSLRRLIDAWDGRYPDPAEWKRVAQRAQKEAKKHVRALLRRSAARQKEALLRQFEAAKLRLLRELGRYLVCLGASTDDLNAGLSEQMTRDIASAGRLRRCIGRLGGYPEWSIDLQRELAEFVSGLSDNERRARRAGSELDAAFDDPRWQAGGSAGA